MIRDGWLLARRSQNFTLQWHLTNACPFHCRHCYDRSPRGELDRAEALRVLDDLADFGRRHRVRPALSLSGGDPLCYPHFWAVYRRAAEFGWPVSILGNPVPAEMVERLCAISRPSYYQVSLEGLRDHNDAIRGAGHYDRVMTFLADARRLGLPTHVMLTLTRENLDQVIPLGRELRGWTERFTFNRLAQVGEGASLALPEPSAFAAFLQRYLEERRVNPVLGLKDNLFNVLFALRGRAPFSGCTGHGCGAAFNFVALLPDGEVHACRKFPSLLGSLRTRRLDEIYSSDIAIRYRAGPKDCRDCRLNRSCRGCPAVTFGRGLDPHTARDPFCFHSKAVGTPSPGVPVD
jgi:selenobiotic family peptide radical SAM maturase